ncbi:MAG: WD40 repeat domain-containing protein, partial [Thermoguttaceae bacterium]
MRSNAFFLFRSLLGASAVLLLSVLIYADDALKDGDVIQLKCTSASALVQWLSGDTNEGVVQLIKEQDQTSTCWQVYEEDRFVRLRCLDRRSGDLCWLKGVAGKKHLELQKDSKDTSGILWLSPADKNGTHLRWIDPNAAPVNSNISLAELSGDNSGSWEIIKATPGIGPATYANVALSGKVHLLVQQGHSADASISSVAISPDERLVLTGAFDQSIRLWDRVTGKEVRRFEGCPLPVDFVGFSRDGQYVLAGYSGGRTKIWDARTAQEVRSFPAGSWPVVISPDCQQILSRSGSKAARVWDMNTGKEICQLKGHASEITAAAFSPDGGRVLTGSADKTVRLWDAANGNQIAIFFGHTDTVESVCFAPGNGCIVTGSRDNTVRVWDSDTRKEVYLLQGDKNSRKVRKGSVAEISQAKGGWQILAIDDAGSLRLFDGTTGKELQRVGQQGISGTISANGHYAAITHQAEVILIDVAAAKVAGRFESHHDWVTSVAFSPNGRQLVIGYHGRTARLWDFSLGREWRNLHGHTDSVDCVAFSPDGHRVLTGSADTTARLWDIDTGKELQRFEGHSKPFLSVQFSPDGRQVLACSLDSKQKAKLWDVATGQELRQFGTHPFTLTARFSTDGKQILTGGPRTASVWDAASGEEIRRFAQPDAATYTSAYFLPDCQKVLTFNQKWPGTHFFF